MNIKKPICHKTEKITRIANASPKQEKHIKKVSLLSKIKIDGNKKGAFLAVLFARNGAVITSTYTDNFARKSVERELADLFKKKEISYYGEAIVSVTNQSTGADDAWITNTDKF